jgi:phosphosulfolactate phosphohydrolase-like enzyme
MTSSNNYSAAKGAIQLHKKNVLLIPEAGQAGRFILELITYCGGIVRLLQTGLV